MEEITEKAVQEKLDKGETLTKEESAFVMSSPPEGVAEAIDTEPEDKEPGEEVDIDADPGEKKGKETAEAKIEKKADTEAKEKPSETPEPVVEKKPDEGTLHSKVEGELDKPDGQEDLTGFSEREKGLFYEMKKSRKRAQKAEEDRDALVFEKIKAAKLAQERKPEPVAEPEEDPFGKDVDPEDFPTIGKLKEISAKMAEKEAEATKARERHLTVRVSEMNARQMIEVRKENGKDAPDYDEVLELAPVIIEGNPDYEKVIYEAYVKGKNAALITYDLIRKDPRFNSLFKPSATETPAKVETKPDNSDAGKKTLDKINANEAKPKTSGASGAGGGGGGEEYTVDQLLRMTPGQFRKVPKAVRDKFLYNA